MNLLIVLLVLILAFCLECHGYAKGKQKGLKQGYCLGRTDANLWWLKVECEVDQERQEIWKENL
jgi:hypothetical protein